MYEALYKAGERFKFVQFCFHDMKIVTISNILTKVQHVVHIVIHWDIRLASTVQVSNDRLRDRKLHLRLLLWFCYHFVSLHQALQLQYFYFHPFIS